MNLVDPKNLFADDGKNNLYFTDYISDNNFNPTNYAERRKKMFYHLMKQLLLKNLLI